MGMHASIDIRFTEKINLSKVFNALLENGWGINDYGKVSYMDNDDYEWKEEKIENYEIVVFNLEKRFYQNNITSINFLYKNLLGGSFIFIDKFTISFNININRRKLGNSLHTDFSFYLKKMFCILNNSCTITCYESP